MATQVASLMINVAANVAELRKGFDQAGKVVQGFGQTVETIGNSIKTAIGALSFAEATRRVMALIDEVGNMGEIAQTMALSTDEMQAFTAAMAEAGLSAEKSAGLMGKAA